MSKEFTCPECGKLIDLDEVNKKHLEKLADQQKKDLKKEMNDDLRAKLIKEITPQLTQEAQNKVKFKHEKELEKEKIKRERAEQHVIKIEENVED